MTHQLTSDTVEPVSGTPRMITVGYYAAAEDAAGTARERLHTAATTIGEIGRASCRERV